MISCALRYFFRKVLVNYKFVCKHCSFIIDEVQDSGVGEESSRNDEDNPLRQVSAV